MTREEALEKMEEKVDEAIRLFGEFPLILHREEFYSDLRLNPVKPEKARYINTTLVINTRDREDDEEGFEYRIGIGAEVKYGSVKEEELAESFADFEARVEEAIAKVREAEDVEAAIAELDRAAEEEYERLAKEIDERARKLRPLYIIGGILFVVGLVILFFVATRA